MSDCDAVADYFNHLVNHVLAPISSELAKEGINVSVDKMLSIIKATKYTSPTLATEYPSPTSNGRSASTQSTGGKGRTKVVTGATCMHEFKKGDRKGKLCGKPAMAGSKYCKLCAGKKHDDDITVSTASSSTTKTKAKPVEEQDSIDVIEISGGLYRETTKNLALRVVDNNFVVFGIFKQGLRDEEARDPSNVLPLTSEAIDFATNKGLTVVKEKKIEDNAAAQEFASKVANLF
jgi:hypothetical protein